MKPHHCRYCGDLLRTWHERECHIDMRAVNDGVCHAPSSTLSPEEVERRRALDHTFDMKKMRERVRELSDPRTASATLRVVERMTVRGRRGRAVNVVRDLYLLSLDTAKERGVCPDPSNDNALARANLTQPPERGADNQT